MSAPGCLGMHDLSPVLIRGQPPSYPEVRPPFPLCGTYMHVLHADQAMQVVPDLDLELGLVTTRGHLEGANLCGGRVGQGNKERPG
jgi:hypothetical protein